MKVGDSWWMLPANCSYWHVIPGGDVDEPNFGLRWAMYHFAGGDSFVCGLMVFALCQLALIRVQAVPPRRWLIIGSRLAFVWAIAVLPPIPVPLVVAFLGTLALWYFSQWRRRSTGAPVEVPAPSRIDASARSASRQPRESLLCSCLAGLALAAAGNEVLHFQSPSNLPAVATLSVVGDSITAGLNDGEDTWPRKLARQTGIEVRDASQPGATLKSALGQVELLNPLPADLLLLEIGGNDLLEGLPVNEFDHDLDRLLQACVKQGRQTVMFELPLPPLATRYGAIQRRLAYRYRIPLIPRRKFLGVLTAAGATVDGIHLSKSGQRQLADLVQNLLNLASDSSSATVGYRHLEPVRSQNR